MINERKNRKEASRGNNTKGNTPAAALPRILYHGTCLSYVCDRLKQYGSYRHSQRESSRVHLTDNASRALSTALERARDYGGEPAVLIVDTILLAEPPEGCKSPWLVQSLEADCFVIYEPLFTKEGVVGLDDVSELQAVAEGSVGGGTESWGPLGLGSGR